MITRLNLGLVVAVIGVVLAVVRHGFGVEVFHYWFVAVVFANVWTAVSHIRRVRGGASLWASPISPRFCTAKRLGAGAAVFSIFALLDVLLVSGTSLRMLHGLLVANYPLPALALTALLLGSPPPEER